MVGLQLPGIERRVGTKKERKQGSISPPTDIDKKDEDVRAAY